MSYEENTNLVRKLRKNEHILICQNCGKEFSLIITQYDFRNNKYRKFCSRQCANKRVHSNETKHKISETLKKTFKTELTTVQKRYLQNPKKCKICGNSIPFEKRRKTFCSTECYNIFNRRSKPSKLKKEKCIDDVNKTQKRVHKIDLAYYNDHPSFCKYCGKQISFERRHKRTCSEECLHLLRITSGSQNGRKSAESIVKRSKNEIAFAALCKCVFTNCEITTNETIFNGWDASMA